MNDTAVAVSLLVSAILACVFLLLFPIQGARGALPPRAAMRGGSLMTIMSVGFTAQVAWESEVTKQLPDLLIFLGGLAAIIGAAWQGFGDVFCYKYAQKMSWSQAWVASLRSDLPLIAEAGENAPKDLHRTGKKGDRLN